MSLNERDVDVLARTIWGEARGVPGRSPLAGHNASDCMSVTQHNQHATLSA